MSAVPALTLRALRGRARVPGYARLLTTACAADPPPFGLAWYGERYRALACEPGWLGQSILVNAAREGKGARELWALAGRTPDPTVAEQIRRHAVDESGHALMYLGMLHTLFPDAVPTRGWRELRSLSPRYRAVQRPPRRAAVSEEVVLDALIQMNLGEIRTRINQLLLRPVALAACPASRRARLSGALAALLEDETRHVAYTARLIEAGLGRDAVFVHRAMRRRLRQFNRLTLREVGASTFATT